jgi:hypothetical protein
VLDGIKMAPAFVQGTGPTANSGASAVATVAQAYGSNNSAGNLLVACITWDRSSGAGNRDLISGVADTRSQTWTQVVQSNDLTNNQDFSMWYFPNCAAGANTVTATFSGGSRAFAAIIIAEYSGVLTTSPIDGTPVGQNASGTTAANNCTSTSTTTAVNGDLIVGAWMKDDTASTPTAGTGFTKRPDTLTDHSIIMEDLVQATAGAIAATFTQSVAGRYLALVAGFQASAAAAVIPDLIMAPMRRN